MIDSLITVVVPVYNVENYLNHCIESILGQTYMNLEVILVDDGSLDRSGIICDEYSRLDKRVKVIHQENQGLSSARNTAIEMANGEYITFIDSDDWIDKDMIQYLFDVMLLNSAQIAVTGLVNAYENGVYIKNSKSNSLKIMNRVEALRCFLFNEYLTPCVCGKLYLTSLWNGIRCPVGKLFEDQFTTYKLIEKSSKIVFDPNGRYYYRKRNGSIGHTFFSKRTYDLYYGINEEYEYLSNNYPKIKNTLCVAKIVWELVFINMMIASGFQDKVLILKARKFAKTHLADVVKCKYINKTRKIQIIIFIINFNCYKKIYLFYKNRKQIA